MDQDLKQISYYGVVSSPLINMLINFHIGMKIICVAAPLVLVMQREGSPHIKRALFVRDGFDSPGALKVSVVFLTRHIKYEIS
jgi:hypothetical protein